MGTIPLQCQCGQVKGRAIDISPETVNRVVCYCDDCQNFAHYLKQAERTLNEHGGTDIVQITPPQIQIDQGLEQLRSVRLKEKGLIRWYTQCCQTPVANTVSESIPFVGLIHCFWAESSEEQKTLGPVRYRIYGKFASGETPSEVSQGVPLLFILRNIIRVLGAKIRGLNQPSPFFDLKGIPISSPIIVEQVKT